MKRFRAGARSLVLVPVAMLGAFAIVACSDDDGGGEASDEEYLANFCGATNDFSEEFLALAMSGDMEDEEEVMRSLGDAASSFADELRGMGVPSDMREFHDAYTDVIGEMGERLQDGDMSALDDPGDLPELSDDVNDRLTEAAEGVEECEDFSGF